MMRLIVACALIGMTLAGCLGGTEDAPTTNEAWEAIGAAIYQPDHEHTIRDQHEEIAIQTTPFTRGTLYDDGRSHGMYSEADVHQDLIAVAVVTGADGVDLDIVFLDRGALPELQVVGRFSEPGAYGDVKFDKERPWVYVAYPGVRATGTGAVNEYAGMAFSIWDIGDLDAPRRIGEARGLGCHMVNTMPVAGTTYVWCTTSAGAMTFRIVELPGGPLEVVGIPVGSGLPLNDLEFQRQTAYYAPLTPAGASLTFSNHDMTAQADPLTGAPVMVSAHELNGIRIWDAAQPETMAELSNWVGEGAPEPLERVHTAALVEVDGKRIGIGSTETYWNAVPSVYFVDFTDLDAPVLLSRWSPPGIPEDDIGVYSTHNFQVIGTTMYLSNFHAGTWILDISDPSDVRPLGLRKAVWDTGFPFPERNILGEPLTTSQIWDVLVVDGYVLTTDIANGVEVFAYHGDPVGDPAWTGFL